MSRVRIATISGVLALTALLTLPFTVAAKPGGGGAGFHGAGFHGAGFHGAGFGHRAPFRNQRAFRRFPGYGGVGVYDPYPFTTAYGVGDNVIEKFILPPEPPRALTCHRSQETVTVPADDGGPAKQIVVTRC